MSFNNGDKKGRAKKQIAPQIRVLSESAMAPVYDNLDVAKMAAIARSNATSGDIDLQFTGVQSPQTQEGNGFVLVAGLT